MNLATITDNSFFNNFNRAYVHFLTTQFVTWYRTTHHYPTCTWCIPVSPLTYQDPSSTLILICYFCMVIWNTSCGKNSITNGGFLSLTVTPVTWSLGIINHFVLSQFHIILVFLYFLLQISWYLMCRGYSPNNSTMMLAIQL